MTTLRFKSTIAVTFFLVVIALALSTIYVNHAEEAERQSARRTAGEQASLLADVVGREIAGGADRARVEALVHSVVTSRGYAWGAVRDAEETVASVLSSVSAAGDILEVMVPVRTAPGAESVATLALGISLSASRHRLEELRLRAIVVTAVVILLAAVGTMFLVGTIVGPIQELAQAATRFSEGDFDFHMRHTSNDEVGVLTNAFHEMARYLRDAKNRQAQFQTELADRVREKTREINQTREHLSNVVENVGASIIVADLDGTIVSANTHTMHIFGSKPEWTVGRNLAEFSCDSSHDNEVLKGLLLHAGAPLTYEAKMHLDRRAELDLLITHTLLRDTHGDAAGILQITKDISQLKRMEERLVHSDRLSRMGEMAGEIGHELNNYLMAIGGRAELIPMSLDHGREDKVRKNAELIAEQVSEMRKLTDGLLQSARKETSPVDLDLNELVAASVDFVRPQNKFDGIRVQVQLAPGAVPVFADPQQIRQIVLNLLVNGAESIHDHCGDKSGEIRVETFRTEEETGFRVADTGGGIDEETRKRIFEPHFTTKDTGHGFGLAVCHRVVANHAGRIAVDSQAGEGASFTVSLPIVGANASAKPKDARTPARG